jgi:putative molybdopterin biosynthesis protein
MKEMLKPDEVAEMLGVAKITIYRLIDKRQLPVYRVGRRLRFRKEEIEDYLAKVRQYPT